MKYAITWIAALVAIACGLLFFESDLLWKVQELNLFQETSLFFKEQMVVPAGMLTYIGTYLTQLFYYPWLGVTVLCLCWLLLLWLLKRTFATPARWAAMLLIPVALLLLTDVDLGYWIYMLKLRGHFFLTTIATISVVALLWGFRTLPDKFGLRAIWMLITCIAGYPLLGIYGLAATLLMGIWSWRLVPRGRASLYTLLAVLVIIAMPLFSYRYMYHETNFANIYYAGLPVFFITEEYHLYYIPYYLLALFMVVMVCLPIGANNEKRKSTAKVWIPWVVQAVVMLVGVWSVVHFWYKDENFHHEVKMQHLIAQNHWEGVLEDAARQHDEPTRDIVVMRNIALSRLGRQAELMYQYPNGSKAYNAPFGMRQMLVSGPLIYYQYGLLNSCSRLTTEMGVEFGWRAENFKYLIRCALLNGEKQVAKKYINILKTTLFFGEWAEKAEKMLDNPQLIAKDHEMEPITHMLHYEDKLRGDQGYVERFVMTQLAKNSYYHDPVFLEQSLLASLWVKDSKLFWHHFDNYIYTHPNGPIPVVYQEAAYLFSQIENRPNLEQMPVSQGVKDSFEKFAQTLSQYEGMEVDDVREQMGTLYNDTYYYDYYLMSNLPEY